MCYLYLCQTSQLVQYFMSQFVTNILTYLLKRSNMCGHFKIRLLKSPRQWKLYKSLVFIILVKIDTENPNAYSYNSTHSHILITDSESCARGTSPRRRVLRPPPGDYIKPDLFQKNFQKISDLVRPGDIDTLPVSLEEPGLSEKETRPRYVFGFCFRDTSSCFKTKITTIYKFSLINT